MTFHFLLFLILPFLSAMVRSDDRLWYYTCTVRLPKVTHPVRIVILWKNRRDKTPRKVLLTNRTRWEINRILKVYRQRWTGTETFHRDGKQELGMGDCQLRSGQPQLNRLQPLHSLCRLQTIRPRLLNSLQT